jgi:hypothetical protein
VCERTLRKEKKKGSNIAISQEFTNLPHSSVATGFVRENTHHLGVLRQRKH